MSITVPDVCANNRAQNDALTTPRLLSTTATTSLPAALVDTSTNGGLSLHTTFNESPLLQSNRTASETHAHMMSVNQAQQDETTARDHYSSDCAAVPPSRSAAQPDSNSPHMHVSASNGVKGRAWGVRGSGFKTSKDGGEKKKGLLLF